MALPKRGNRAKTNGTKNPNSKPVAKAPINKKPTPKPKPKAKPKNPMAKKAAVSENVSGGARRKRKPVA